MNQFGFNTPVRGLPNGVLLVSLSSSTATTIYAYAVPEPSSTVLNGLGLLAPS